MNTILIVDDHILFREGIANIINRWDDFQVIGEASNGQEALEKAHQLLPDVVLMDISMPVMDGIQATIRIKREIPSVKIVILTMSEENDDLFAAIKNGATGYILKDTPSKRLHDQLRGLMRDESPISGVMASKILQEFTAPTSPEIKTGVTIDTLTARELEILELITRGLTNQEIASKLFLSENTIKKYISNILNKLQVNNRVEAAMLAMRKGLIDH
ncbi:MAG: response regulator transcription factor [Anaerolineae bacterium]|jgi:DNA-binding NarL/FixJ family response regulator|nr:response regulator transcription factor [Anaerolineae bacterium]